MWWIIKDESSPIWKLSGCSDWSVQLSVIKGFQLSGVEKKKNIQCNFSVSKTITLMWLHENASFVGWWLWLFLSDRGFHSCLQPFAACHSPTLSPAFLSSTAVSFKRHKSPAKYMYSMKINSLFNKKGKEKDLFYRCFEHKESCKRPACWGVDSQWVQQWLPFHNATDGAWTKLIR